MQPWLLVVSLALVPLRVLDARITKLQQHLAFSNLTLGDRMTLRTRLREDMFARYRIMEEVEEDTDDNPIS